MRISDWSSDVCSSDLHRCLPSPHVWNYCYRLHSSLQAFTNGPIPRCILCRLPSPNVQCFPFFFTCADDDASGTTCCNTANEPDAISRSQWVYQRQPRQTRSAEHTSELQSLLRSSYAVFCLTHNNTRNRVRPSHLQAVDWHN